MKLFSIIFLAIYVFGIFGKPSEDSHNDKSVQEYVDSLVDHDKFKSKGMHSLNDTTIKNIWSHFKSKHNRSYHSSEEENKRFNTFHGHLKYVLESNNNETCTFKLELNDYADWTVEEFKAKKTGLKVDSITKRNARDIGKDEDSLPENTDNFDEGRPPMRRLKRQTVYTSFDWRSKYVVSSVKDQKECGSCYAFATTAVLESLYARKWGSNYLTNFSPQEIVDCSTSYGNYGCDGGNYRPCLNYLSARGNKITTLSSYPYVGYEKVCQTSSSSSAYLGSIQAWQVPTGDEKTMASALVNYGPLWVALYASSQQFMFYRSGVLSVSGCPNSVYYLDHAVVAVGYGYDSTYGMNYWIIKNSWSQYWGENGYIRIAKDRGNMC
ncbi:unnamed protein product, partial [Rotaria sp. Silwood1]